MPFRIPTTKEQKDKALAEFESQLGQNAPINAKAFLRVLSSIEAALSAGLYKYASDRAQQALVLTATNGGLDNLGNNYGVVRKAAEAAQFTIELPATNGTVIPVTVDFVGDSNGIRYSNDSAQVAAGGVATLNVTAKQTGAIGNLQIGDTLTIGTTVAGAESQATITVVTNTGVERESDELYRARILTVIRSVPGGGNSADYRIWAQEVAGVARAYPFSGNPVGSATPSAPPERTVYVEATTDIDPDGLAPPSLLAEVRSSITTDPETGEARQPLGLTDDTLYVESIIRTGFYVQISDLQVSSSKLSQVQADIETSLALYFSSVRPFVDGLDPTIDRNDAITDPSVSSVVNDVATAAGGSVGAIIFDVTPGTSIPRYQLNQNELAKLSGVSFA